MESSLYIRVLALLELSETYTRDILRGLVERFEHETSVLLQVSDIHLDDMARKRLRHCDGVVGSFSTPSDLVASVGGDFPVINVSSRGTEWSRFSVVTDGVGLFRRVTDHFRERGIRSMALYGDEWQQVDDDSLHHCREAGVAFRGLFLEPDSGRALDDRTIGVFCDWLRTLPRPLGLLCRSDSWAAHALEMCRLLEVSVPHEVSIVGVGNDKVHVFSVHPTLSSVDMRYRQVGRTAGEDLLGWIRGAPPEVSVKTIPVGRIAVRQSSDLYTVKDQLVQDALRWMDVHLSDGGQMEELAAALRVSRRTLETRFTQALGTSPARFFRACRIRRAQELLEDPTLNITEVAYAAGFSSSSHFSASFLKTFGVTPRDYRMRTEG